MWTVCFTAWLLVVHVQGQGIARKPGCRDRGRRGGVGTPPGTRMSSELRPVGAPQVRMLYVGRLQTAHYYRK